MKISYAIMNKHIQSDFNLVIKVTIYKYLEREERTDLDCLKYACLRIVVITQENIISNIVTSDSYYLKIIM